jgi:hypothetical protein
MGSIAVKLDLKGIVENVIVVGDAVPEGYQRVSVAIGVGQNLAEVENAAALETAQASRKAAYTAEADPLFFMSQRGEATVEEWQAKVAEIKARYPYPEETQA